MPNKDATGSVIEKWCSATVFAIKTLTSFGLWMSASDRGFTLIDRNTISRLQIFGANAGWHCGHNGREKNKGGISVKQVDETMYDYYDGKHGQNWREQKSTVPEIHVLGENRILLGNRSNSRVH